MIKLKDGEVLCPNCKGSGLMEGLWECFPFSGWRRRLIACSFCFSTGKMDWIDAVKGQKTPPDGFWSYIWNVRYIQHIAGNDDVKYKFPLIPPKYSKIKRFTGVQ